MKCPVPECNGELPDGEYTYLYCTGRPNVHYFSRELLGRITIAPLPKPEPWKPRTIEQLNGEMGIGHGSVADWIVQARTDDIVRMLQEEIVKTSGYSAIACRHLEDVVKRIREFE